MNFLARALATTAVWSIAAVVSLRLRHPMVALACGAVAVTMTLLIWSYHSKNRGG
jgi:hypothetical protein